MAALLAYNESKATAAAPFVSCTEMKKKSVFIGKVTPIRAIDFHPACSGGDLPHNSSRPQESFIFK